uniref:BdrC2- n=1 Tax=Borrelia hermsii TaxID=140 RepID=Q9RG94_BORHE|nr:BdrC2- [Borrelia hermsii]
MLRLFSTVSILLSRSLMSDFRLASTFSSLRLKVVSKYPISL